MLPDHVYEELHKAAIALDEGDVVEIGTAHGAATTAIALGLLQKKSPNLIYTVDTYGGRFSSRSAYGSPEDNIQIVNNNFAKTGIAHIVKMFKGTSEEFVKGGTCPDDISMLMLDADGKIDRDFLLFYNRVKPGGLIVIDDADDAIHLSVSSTGEPFVDLKHRITHILISRLAEEGFIKDLNMISNTLFCRSTGKKIHKDFFLQIAIESYRELVLSPCGIGWNDLALIAPRSSEALKVLKFYDKFSRYLNFFKRVKAKLTFRN